MRRSLIGAVGLWAVLAGPSTLAADPTPAPATTSPLPTPSIHAPANGTYWQTNFFKRLLQDQSYLFRTWVPHESRNPAFCAPLLGSIVLAQGADDGGLDLRIERRVEGWGRSGAEGPARFFTRVGDALPTAALLGGGYLVARWTGHTRFQQATSLAAQAMVSAGIYSFALKRVSRRTRPSGGGDGEFWVDRPPAGQENGSFPSGHATAAFAVAAAFAHSYPERRWVAGLTYSLASLIAASRIVLGRHFPSDVLAGALLGDSLGRMVVARERGIGGARRARWNLEPLIDPRNGGVGLAYHRSW